MLSSLKPARTECQTAANPCRPRRQAGFTLVEMLIAVAIAVVILGMGVPSLKEWNSGAKARNRAESIAQGLSLARTQALARSWFVAFTINTDGGWTVSCTPVKDENGNGTEDEADCMFTRSTPGSDLSQSVYTETRLPSAATTVTFGPSGMRAANRDSSASLQSITLASPDPTGSVRVMVSAGGQISTCDPNAPSTATKSC